MLRSALRTLTVLALASAVAIPALAALPPAPVAKKVPVVDDYFGTKITDPYRWMEQPGDPDLQAYLKTQNDRTHSILDSIPGRKDLATRLTALSQTINSSSNVARRGGMLFYEKLAPDSSIPKLYVRAGIGGTERVLLDPSTMSAKGSPQIALSYYVPSDDGSKVAVGLAAGGSENASLRILDTASGKLLPDNVDRARFGATSWRADGTGVYYIRMQQVPAGSPPEMLYQNVRTYLHVLGQDPASDQAIFGAGSPGVTANPYDFAIAVVSPLSQYAFAILKRGVQNEIQLYVAPKTDLDGGKAAWRKVVSLSDQVTDATVHGTDLYMLSHKDALRYKVTKISLTGSADVASATTIIAPSDRVVTALGSAKDALYVQSLEDGLGRMTRVAWTGERSEVPLPVNGAISDTSTDPVSDGFLAKLESWTISPLWYAYDPTAKTLVDTKLDPPSPIDYSAITSEEVKVKARDGVMIPLSIIHRKDMKKDGSNPTLLQAYGSYGINTTPGFSPIRLGWFEHGGITAIAHVRGGGEYGEEWHLAGKDANKINTINDYIDCAKWMIDQKYTSPGKLGGLGGSAGGITMGGAIDNAPELFAAIIDEVPVSDQLRIEFSTNGPPNIPEFGSVKTAEGFKNLYATSAVHHVKPGGMYPAVMLTTGANDPRVDPWQAAKMGATLQADSASGKPILLRVEFSGGHGFGETKAQQVSETSDIYSFLLWNMSVPGFQPSI